MRAALADAAAAKPAPLRTGEDEVVMLDEPFLLEAITSGLYWRVLDHMRQDGPQAWRTWSVAYAEMTEALAEELIEALAPPLVDGSSTFFTEETIKAAFTVKKGITPPTPRPASSSATAWPCSRSTST